MSDLRAAHEAGLERTRVATAAYAALKRTKTLNEHRLVVYRCSHRCLLLDVVQLPQGRIYASTRYKLSPAVNETTSNADGRANNSEDGDRRWPPRAYFAQDAMNPSVACDHVRPGSIPDEEIDADVEAGAVELVWPKR